MTDLEIAIARVEAASVEMESALAVLVDMNRTRELTPLEVLALFKAHNRARRSVA